MHAILKKYSLLIPALLLSYIIPLPAAAQDMSISGDSPRYSSRPEHQALWKYMHAVADGLPGGEFKPASPAEWEKRAPEVRAGVMNALGIDTLEKTPLNARVIGVVDKPDFTIEKIIFESRPKFYVTGNLWKPKGATGKLPVLLWVHGHSANAKAAYGWPHLTLPNKGIMVFAIDGVGFGERIPQEHNLNGVCWTIGAGTLGFEIWDNIRAIDYLVSRPDVDASRIGVAGRSGGGTQSLYMTAVEQRLRASVVMAGMSTFQAAYIEHGDGHCICNYPNGTLSKALSAEMLAVGAPRMDILVIQGQMDPLFPAAKSEESFNLARNVFELFGRRNSIKFFSDIGKHPATDQQIRETIKFIVKALNPGVKDYSVPEYAEPEPNELKVGLPDDNINTLQNCRTEADRIPKQNTDSKEQWSASVSSMRQKLNAIVYPKAPASTLNPIVESTENKDGYTVERISIETEPGLRIYLSLYIPDAGTGKRASTIYLYRRGIFKMMEMLKDNPGMFRQGGTSIAVVPDLRGLGEQSFYKSGATEMKRNYREYELSSSSALMGRPLAAMRAYDVIRINEYLATRSDIDPAAISLDGEFDMAHIALIAAAAEPKLAADPDKSIITLRDLPGTFFLEKLSEKRSMDFYVPGILRIADIPALAGAIAPRSLLIAPRSTEDSAAFGLTRRAYGLLDATLRLTFEK